MTRATFAFALSGMIAAATPAFANANDPIFGPGTYDRTTGALRYYEDIAASGGWVSLPASVQSLKEGASGAGVQALRNRLAISGDLNANLSVGDTFDRALGDALRRFQRRHGLSETATVGALTLKALNVPVSARLMQLRATMERMRNNGFQFPQRYVVVNIPSASVEAVSNNRVERRHVAVVGRKDRPSPVLEARINGVTLNPFWTAPISIVRNDIMPKARKDQSFLAQSGMRLIGAGGEEISPSSVDWSGKSGVNFSLRQDPGPGNALGVVRIDMPNSQSVYIHDTPKKELFRSDVRFHSSGCARVQGVQDLAAWLMQEGGLTRADIDAGIASGDTKAFRLARPVSVAWVYLTAWGDGLGDVQFREDIYGLDDSAKDIASSTLVARARAPATTASLPPNAARTAARAPSTAALDLR
jgi:L,D-transpeptidase YcbB